jgi:class 3 adenylate cyclase
MGMSGGGRAPGGRWIADNTEMFYPESVPVDDVVAVVRETHGRLPPGGLQAGFCIHRGEYYDIGGGLYGRDADLVELAAEEYTDGGETIISESARAALADPAAWAFARREDLAALGEFWRVESGPAWTRPVSMTPATMHYPLPFSEELYALFNDTADPEFADGAVTQIRNRFQVTRTVVIIETGAGTISDPVDILESVVLSAHAGRLVEKALPERAEIIENNRGLLLMSFEDGQEALDTTLEITSELAATGKTVRAGLDRGPVLLVPDSGGWSILGSPVNLASKQAHELGKPGKVILTLRAAGGVKLPPPIGRYRAMVSGVELEGVVVDVPPPPPPPEA